MDKYEVRAICFFIFTWMLVVWVFCDVVALKKKVKALEQDVLVIKQSPLVPITEEEFLKMQKEMKERRK
jgi:hypothetical protein